MNNREDTFAITLCLTWLSMPRFESFVAVAVEAHEMYNDIAPPAEAHFEKWILCINIIQHISHGHLRLRITFSGKEQWSVLGALQP